VARRDVVSGYRSRLLLASTIAASVIASAVESQPGWGILSGAPTHYREEDGLQYVDLNIVRYAAMILATAEEAGQTLYCEAQPCERTIEYRIPDATRPGGGGQDIEQLPAMVCREHLEEMLGHAPDEQPLFRRFEWPGEEDG
jgi:hypothetical protein